MEVGLFLAGPPSRGLREQEAGGAWHEVPPTPHSDVWHELTEQAPCSHGDEPRAHESCRHSPAWAPPPPPFAPLRNPEIGLERGSGWPSAPGLGKLPSESQLLHLYCHTPWSLAGGALHHISGVGGVEDLR